MRIFLGLTDAASYLHGLKAGFDELRVDSVFISFRQDSLVRHAVPDSPHLTVYFVQRALQALSARPLPTVLNALARLGLRLLLLLWAIIRCDVFIFAFKETFLKLYDLPLLKLFGKRLIFIFLGSDARPPYLSGTQFRADGTIDVKACVRATRRQKNELHFIERFADLCVNHPPTGHFHEKPFINFTLLGFPFQTPAVPAVPIRSTENSLRIVHAPTRPEQKGTPRIREVIAALRAKGHTIVYQELINVPNDTVLQAIGTCDLVIDELYSDCVLAGVGTEAANLGKLALVGGYAESDLHAIASINGMPIDTYVRPEDLEVSLEKLLTDPQKREALGAQVQHFVATQWTPRQVAERYLRVVHGAIPNQWWCDPQQTRYLHGWGMSEVRARELIRAVIQCGGPAALHVDDKPALKNALLAFAVA